MAAQLDSRHPRVDVEHGADDAIGDTAPEKFFRMGSRPSSTRVPQQALEGLAHGGVIFDDGDQALGLARSSCFGIGTLLQSIPLSFISTWCASARIPSLVDPQRTVS
jgi:hypothetical protein